MRSVILHTATRPLVALLLLFSLYLLLRGHDEPGGGFAGGLLAGIAFILYALAFGVPAARGALTVRPKFLIALGLLVAGLASVWPLVRGDAFLTGVWTQFGVDGLGTFKLGTPLVFDVGVYLLVAGTCLTVAFELKEAT